jgi:hypothetical protein
MAVRDLMAKITPSSVKLVFGLAEKHRQTPHRFIIFSSAGGSVSFGLIALGTEYPDADFREKSKFLAGAGQTCVILCTIVCTIVCTNAPVTTDITTDFQTSKMLKARVKIKARRHVLGLGR